MSRRAGPAAALVAAVLATAALLAPSAASEVSAVDPKDTPTATPIKHFIYLMQENHSFDNYFGTYPGADGLPADACVPVRVDDPKGECVRPYWLGGDPISDLGHTANVFRAQLNSGANDGFIEAFADEGDPHEAGHGVLRRP